MIETFDGTRRTYTGRDLLIKAFDDVLYFVLDVAIDQTGRDETDPSINVVADTSRRDHTIGQSGCGYSSYRESISPVNVRHRD